jgi:N-acetylglucosamine kinase-like BadF-type ATPase
MKYFIGIDGGGTKTDCIITDEKYNQLSALRGGPLNLLASPPSESSKIIFHLINSCLSQLNITFAQLDCIGIGAAGAGRIEDSEKLKRTLKELLPRSIKLNIITDAEAALEGAFNGKSGCILISGTGSIIFGKDQNGVIHRCGGFGKIVGDEGSGYLIGKKGLMAAVREFDGRGEKSLITAFLKEKYQIESGHDIINAIHKNNFDISGVAPLVLASGVKKDNVALKIIDEETEELLSLISCIIKKFKKEDIEISLSGSLISTINVFSIMLKNKLAVSFKSIKIKEPEYPPAMGAIFIAKKKFAEIL